MRRTVDFALARNVKPVSPVLHFNGGLFRSVEFIPRESGRSVEFIPRESGDGAESRSRGINSTLRDVVDLSPDEIKTLITVNRFDWSSVEPSIFGTLFERTLDPAKRSQIGAHYTSRDDILTLLEPVMMTPLRREWDAVRDKCDRLNAEAAWTKARQRNNDACTLAKRRCSHTSIRTDQVRHTPSGNGIRPVPRHTLHGSIHVR